MHTLVNLFSVIYLFAILIYAKKIKDHLLLQFLIFIPYALIFIQVYENNDLLAMAAIGFIISMIANRYGLLLALILNLVLIFKLNLSILIVVGAIGVMSLITMKKSTEKNIYLYELLILLISYLIKSESAESVYVSTAFSCLVLLVGMHRAKNLDLMRSSIMLVKDILLVSLMVNVPFEMLHYVLFIWLITTIGRHYYGSVSFYQLITSSFILLVSVGMAEAKTFILFIVMYNLASNIRFDKLIIRDANMLKVIKGVIMSSPFVVFHAHELLMVAFLLIVLHALTSLKDELHHESFITFFFIVVLFMIIINFSYYQVDFIYQSLLILIAIGLQFTPSFSLLEKSRLLNYMNNIKNIMIQNRKKIRQESDSSLLNPRAGFNVGPHVIASERLVASRAIWTLRYFVYLVMLLIFFFLIKGIS
jgi:hypothetical protein